MITSVENARSVLRGARRAVLGTVAALIFSALVPAGCGDDSDDPWGGGGLVCADGEAWTRAVPVDGQGGGGGFHGMIFKQNGDFIGLYSDDNVNWMVIRNGTYSTSGNTLTVSTEGTVTYSVSGNTLVIPMNGESLTYTKKSGIRISGNLGGD